MNQTPQGGFVYMPEFNIGFVLNRSFEVIISHPLAFFGLTAIATLPTIFLMLISPPTLAGPNVAVILIPVAIGGFFSLAIQGAIAFGVYDALRGEDVSIVDCLVTGFSRILSIFLASLAAGLCLGIGLMLLIIPGLIILTMIFVAIPACTVEKMGPIECLNRSAELTKGNRLKVLGLIVIYTLMTMIIDFLSGFITETVSASPMAAFYINQIVSILPTTFYSVMVGVAYFDLRSNLEGVDVGSLANVFD